MPGTPPDSRQPTLEPDELRATLRAELGAIYNARMGSTYERLAIPAIVSLARQHAASKGISHQTVAVEIGDLLKAGCARIGGEKAEGLLVLLAVDEFPFPSRVRRGDEAAARFGLRGGDDSLRKSKYGLTPLDELAEQLVSIAADLAQNSDESPQDDEDPDDGSDESPQDDEEPDDGSVAAREEKALASNRSSDKDPWAALRPLIQWTQDHEYLSVGIFLFVLFFAIATTMSVLTSIHDKLRVIYPYVPNVPATGSTRCHAIEPRREIEIHAKGPLNAFASKPPLTRWKQNPDDLSSFGNDAWLLFAYMNRTDTTQTRLFARVTIEGSDLTILDGTACIVTPTIGQVGKHVAVSALTSSDGIQVGPLSPKTVAYLTFAAHYSPPPGTSGLLSAQCEDVESRVATEVFNFGRAHFDLPFETATCR